MDFKTTSDIAVFIQKKRDEKENQDYGLGVGEAQNFLREFNEKICSEEAKLQILGNLEKPFIDIKVLNPQIFASKVGLWNFQKGLDAGQMRPAENGVSWALQPSRVNIDGVDYWRVYILVQKNTGSYVQNYNTNLEYTESVSTTKKPPVSIGCQSEQTGVSIGCQTEQPSSFDTYLWQIVLAMIFFYLFSTKI